MSAIDNQQQLAITSDLFTPLRGVHPQCCQHTLPVVTLRVLFLHHDASLSFENDYFSLYTWSKKSLFFLPEAFGGRKICQKCVCGRGPARIPLGELHDAPRLPSRLRKGIPLLPSSHLLHHSSLSTPEIVTPEILAPSALAILGVFGASTPESCQYPLK